MAPSVIVLGASGNVGRFVIAELLNQRSSFNRIAILSDPAKVDRFKDAKAKGVEVIAGSFVDPASFKGFDIVVSLLGPPVFSRQPEIVDAAISAGAMHFYPSEIGLDISRPGFAKEKYWQDKLVTRRYLADLVKRNPRFGYTILLIGMVTEFVVETPLFGVDKEKKTVDFVGTPESKITFTSFPDIARYLVASLPSAKPGERTIRVAGETLTAAKLFEILSRVQNIPYEVRYTPLAKAKEIEEKYEREGNESMTQLMSLKYGIGELGWLDKNDNSQFDFKPETVEETFKRLSQ